MNQISNHVISELLQSRSVDELLHGLSLHGVDDPYVLSIASASPDELLDLIEVAPSEQPTNIKELLIAVRLAPHQCTLLLLNEMALRKLPGVETTFPGDKSLQLFRKWIESGTHPASAATQHRQSMVALEQIAEKKRFVRHKEIVDTLGSMTREQSTALKNSRAMVTLLVCVCYAVEEIETDKFCEWAEEALLQFLDSFTDSGRDDASLWLLDNFERCLFAD